MLGEETHNSDGALEAEARDTRAALAKACRGVRERLLATVADLGALRVEIDLALAEIAASDPENPRAPG
jgi:hypothetical protein